MKFEFQELQLKKQGSWLLRIIKSQHNRRSLVFIIIGGIAGFLYFYFTQGQKMDVIPTNEILKSVGVGAFFGFFITNSPCARGRC